MSLLICVGCSQFPLTPVVITATPDPRIVQITVTPAAVPPQPTFPPVVIGPSPTSIASVFQPTIDPPAAITNTPGALPTTPAPTSPTPLPPTTPAPVNSATPDPRPTVTRRQIYIAQEDFQGGFIFWIQATADMWVLLPDRLPNPGDPLTIPSSGQWRIYKDTFKDGELEVDPGITPPSGSLYQPRRGFGKLWRETPELRNALGWALTPEFGLTTPYTYIPGGTVENGVYIPAPGVHSLITLGRSTFEFYEPKPGEPFGTWKRVG